MQHHTNSRTEQEQLWQGRVNTFMQQIEESHQWIDREIAESILVLKELGITARGISSGNLEEVPYAPQISVGRDDLAEEEEHAGQLMQEADEQRKLHTLDEVAPLYHEARRMRRIVTCKHLEERTILLRYLTDFYAERTVSYDCVLTLQDLCHNAILEPQGAQFQVLQPSEQRQQKLQEYQHELRAFTAFLKEIYFSSI